MDVSNNEYKSKANEKIFSRLTNPFLIYDDINNDNTTLNLFVKRSLNLYMSSSLQERQESQEVLFYEKKIFHVIVKIS